LSYAAIERDRRTGQQRRARFLNAPQRSFNAVIAFRSCEIPTVPPSLAEIITIITSFGGCLARKSDPPPGPKAIWIGLQRLRQFVIARAALDQINRTYVE